MAKTSATMAAAPAKAKSAIDRTTYLMNVEDWDNNPSPEFGGQSDILELEIGDVAGPLTYIGFTEMVLEGGAVKVHQAQTANGDTVRCPIAASFIRAFDQAGIQKGDTFATKRNGDAEKKSGKGKGTNMHIYSVKVLTKAQVAA